MSNPFLDYAATIETRSDMRRHKLASRAQERAKKKALFEREQLHKAWLHWHEERKQMLLGGPHRTAAAALADFLEHMSNTAPLVALVQHGPWQCADADTRYTVLSLVDNAIIHLRESAGLPPFDDPLPDEQPDTFIIIREMLK